MPSAFFVFLFSLDYCRGKTFLKESFSPCTPFQRTEQGDLLNTKLIFYFYRGGEKFLVGSADDQTRFL